MYKEASEKLCDLFNFNIPLRWSISHLYQAILNNEPHVPEIAHITTLSGYVHYLLTGKLELGVCEASGMFPISGDDYDSTMLDKFTSLPECESLPFNIRDILPEVKLCGSTETTLTESGASFLDKSGELQSGIPVCPPEGDAGTGMVATNSVKPRTGNISAGTSVFSMLVLDKPLCNMYPEVDVVMTPAGSPVAMIHSNNGCSELDAWVNVFGEFAKLCGADISKDTLYKTLYENALSGDDDCGEIISYNYLANEPVSGVENGKPVIFRTQSSSLTLANLSVHCFIHQLPYSKQVLICWEKRKAFLQTDSPHTVDFSKSKVLRSNCSPILSTCLFAHQNPQVRAVRGEWHCLQHIR